MLYPDEDAENIADLVTANHILAHHDILDGFGHVSVRSLVKPDIYYMSRRAAPAIVRADGILAFDLDSRPIDLDIQALGRHVPPGTSTSNAATGGGVLYGERFIHGEVYRARPDVGAIVHSHSPAVITFGISTKPFVPVIHMAGFLRASTPIFDIRDEHDTGGMLVLNNRTGAAVAKSLGQGPVVLMRGHGDTVVGKTIKEAVFRAIYAELNAKVQMQAIMLGGGVNGLNAAEIAFNPTEIADPERPWQMWRYEVEHLVS